MEIKLMIDPKSKKLIFAEASKDFVDFLLVLPSLPMGKVLKLLESTESFGGSIRNILTSVSTNLDETYLQPEIQIYSLLNPMVISPVTNDQLSITANNGKGYVRERVAYMVFDDLSVKPILTTSIISVMSKFNVSELEERKVEVGTEEALKLLKISFHSTTVLSDVFLETKSEGFEEQGGKVQIKIQFIDKPSVTLDVELSDTVHNVKSRIEDNLGFLVRHQRLIFEGKELEDSQTLADYNVENASTLLLVMYSKANKEQVEITEGLAEQLNRLGVESSQTELQFSNLDGPTARLGGYSSDNDFKVKLTPVQKITRNRKKKKIFDL